MYLFLLQGGNIYLSETFRFLISFPFLVSKFTYVITHTVLNQFLRFSTLKFVLAIKQAPKKSVAGIDWSPVLVHQNII